jgi:GntR family transcriptional regulator
MAAQTKAKIATPQTAALDRRSSAVPAFAQITAVLEDWIRGGRYQAGDRFPTEEELTVMFGVSRLTVRRALASLVADGVLQRSPRRGTFVQATPKLAPVRTALAQAKRQLSTLEAGFSGRFLGAARVTPDRDLKSLFGLKRAEKLLEIRMLRMMQETPLAFIVQHFAPAVGDRIALPQKVGEQPRVLEQLSAQGIAPQRIHQSVGATLADIECATAMGIAVGSPILRFTRLAWDKDGRLLMRAVASFRSDIFEYEMEFADDAVMDGAEK